MTQWNAGMTIPEGEVRRKELNDNNFDSGLASQESRCNLVFCCQKGKGDGWLNCEFFFTGANIPRPQVLGSPASQAHNPNPRQSTLVETLSQFLGTLDMARRLVTVSMTQVSSTVDQ